MIAASPVQRRARFEYRELVVRLELDPRLFRSQWELEAHVNQVIALQLQRLRRDDWEPDGPTEWNALWQASRIKIRRDGRPQGYRTIYEAVVLPLRRPLD